MARPLKESDFFSFFSRGRWKSRRFCDGLVLKAAFNKSQSFTKSIRGKKKEWIPANLSRWKAEQPKWFKIELIPNDFPKKRSRPKAARVVDD